MGKVKVMFVAIGFIINVLLGFSGIVGLFGSILFFVLKKEKDKDDWVFKRKTLAVLVGVFFFR